ncbi:MAG: hypothetical protein LCH26_03815 [Proteobacteria bacterium]|nr:hypothetical protein [Pseudomonadota bacterium]
MMHLTPKILLSAICFMLCAQYTHAQGDFFADEVDPGVFYLTLTKQMLAPHLGAPVTVDNVPHLCTTMEGLGYDQWVALPPGTPVIFLRHDGEGSAWVYDHFLGGNGVQHHVRVRMIPIPHP